MDRVTYVVLLVAACVMYAVATIFNSLSGGGPNGKYLKQNIYHKYQLRPWLMKNKME